MDLLGIIGIVIILVCFYFLLYYMPSRSALILEEYKGIFGTIAALAFFWIGIAAPLMLFMGVTQVVQWISGKTPFLSAAGSFFMSLAAAFVYAIPCWLIYRHAKKKCPAFMQKKLFISMVIAGGGIFFRWIINFACVFIPFFSGFSSVDVSRADVDLHEGDYLTRLNGEPLEFRITAVDITKDGGHMISKDGESFYFRVECTGEIRHGDTGEEMYSTKGS